MEINLRMKSFKVTEGKQTIHIYQTFDASGNSHFEAVRVKTDGTNDLLNRAIKLIKKM